MEPIWWVLTWFLGGHRKSFFRIAFKFYRFELLLSHNIPLVFGFLLWQQISKYIDEHYKNFQNFLNFHLIMCRSVSVVVLVGQINAVVLAILIWAIGTHPGAHCNSPDQQERRNFTHSFLVPPNSPIPGCSSEFLNGRLSQISLPYLKDGRSQGCLSYIKDVFTGLFQRRNQF